MASTSTSHNAASSTTKLLLRLIDEKEGTSCAFSLHASKRTHAFEMADEGAVHENYAYDVELLSEEDLGDITVFLSVNGEEYLECPTSRTPYPMSWGGKGSYWYYRCELDGSRKKLFKLSFGFSAVEVFVVFRDGRPAQTFFTKDIPCICAYENQEQSVSGMMQAIGSAAGTDAARWLFSGVDHDALASGLVDGGMITDSSQSLSGYLDFVDKVANVYEENLPFFRMRAHSRTLKRDEVIDPAYARKLGRRELIWMSRNAESMHRVDRTTGIRMGGDYYMATEVQTERSVKSFDNDENRAVLAFLKEISASLRAVTERVEAEVARLQALAARLSAINAGKGTLLSRVIVETCLRHEAPLSSRAAALRRRCQGLVLAYERAVPGVTALRYKKPRRSKVFQEVKAYSDVYALMLVWPRFDNFDMAKDALLLHTFKMDQLYEYFSLLRMLEWLSEAGFSEDSRLDDPIRSVRYTLEDRRFSNEKQVANLYRLMRGDLSLTLYYQPVLYGDAREEHGITLHRTTPAVPFATSKKDSHWTPDFLIVLEGGRFGERRHIVLDAKYRPIDALGIVTDGGKEGQYRACSFKYKLSTAGAGWDRVDALWLLCGKASKAEVCLFQESSWAASGRMSMRDGIAALSPEANSLDDMFAAIGIEKIVLEAEPVDTGTRVAEVIATAEMVSAVEAVDRENLEEKPSGAYGAEPVMVAIESSVSEAMKSDVGDTDMDGFVEIDSVDGPALAEGDVADRLEAEGDEGLAGSGRAETDIPIEVETEGLSSVGVDDGAPPENVALEDPLLADGNVELAAEPEDLPKLSLDAEVLGLIKKAYSLAADAKLLFDASYSYKRFGFRFALLKEKIVEEDARRYTWDPVDMEDGSYHVYAAWRPGNLQKLKTEVKRAEKQAKKASGVEMATGKASGTRSHAPAKGVSAEAMELVMRLCELTVEKKALFDAADSQRNLGLGHPLLRKSAPTGREARFYSRDAVEIDGELCYVYSSWRPDGVQRLRSAIKQAERALERDQDARESADNTKATTAKSHEVGASALSEANAAQHSCSQTAEKETASRASTPEQKAHATRKKAQLPADSPLIDEARRSHARVAGEWCAERNKGLSFERYESSKDSGRSPAWWHGECDHKWRARLSERLVDPLCPACLASLKSWDERAAKMFHRTRNGNARLRMIADGDRNKACWWNCKKGHAWKETLEELGSREYECPECARLSSFGKR